MKRLKLKAISIGLKHKNTVPNQKIAESLKNGEIIIISDFLQSTGYFEQLTKASLEGIERVVGRKKTTQISQQGFEAIHKIVDLDELTSVIKSTTDIFRSLAPAFTRVLVSEILQRKEPFFLEKEPNVRFHIPYDVSITKQKEFGGWSGKITPHGPHHDSWYSCPVNCINVWIAIGSVKIGNGLSLYPQVYGKRLPCNQAGGIIPNQYYGQALNFELKPGDLLIFKGDHLHASEINSTAETRHVVSFRLTLEKPVFLQKSIYEYDYLYCESQTSLVAKIKQLFVNTIYQIKKNINPLLRSSETQEYVISTPDNSLFDDTSNTFPSLLPVKTIEGKTQASKNLVFPPSELPIGVIRAISQKWCITRLDEKRVIIFSRFCPHKGADLAGGYFNNERIFCPWHNLAFDTKSGSSPCQSLPRLSIFHAVLNDEQDRWEIESSYNHNGEYLT